MDRPSHGALLAYLVLFAAIYAAFGVQSPYLPRLLQDHGLGAEAIGTVLAAGTAIRLAGGPQRATSPTAWMLHGSSSLAALPRPPLPRFFTSRREGSGRCWQ